MTTESPMAQTTHCPGCGEPTETLHEGYCEPCREDRQNELDLFNTRYDWWESLSDTERRDQIRRAM